MAFDLRDRGPIGGVIGILGPRAIHFMKSVVKIEADIESVKAIAVQNAEDINNDRTGLKDRVLVLETKAKVRNETR